MLPELPDPGAVTRTVTGGRRYGSTSPTTGRWPPLWPVFVTATSVDEERADRLDAGVRGKTAQRTSTAFQRMTTQYLLA
ncbi:MAG: hypothetical protein ACRDRW_06705 [Pseudonocardiaceae bacterium]